jgi:hypothetical protein
MTRIQSLASRPKRTLGALAVVLAAVGITVGSGANFTASQANAGNAFTTGTLSLSGSPSSGAILSLTNMKPGDTKTGQIVLSNTGSLPGNFTLKQAIAGASDAGLKNALQLEIVHCSTAVTTDPCDPAATPATGTSVFGSDFMTSFGTSAVSLPGAGSGGSWAPAESNRYKFTVGLLQAVSDNTLQNKTVSATYTWDAQSLTGTAY